MKLLKQFGERMLAWTIIVVVGRGRLAHLGSAGLHVIPGQA
jgi:hypothetical protein